MIGTRKESRKFRFTKRAIESLGPHAQDSPSREAEFSDEACSGLRVVVNKSQPPRKFFQLRYTLRKRKRVIRIGEFPSVSVEEARQRANDLKNMISRGEDPLLEKERQKEALTFHEFVDQHYLPHARQNKKSWEHDERMLRNEMVPTFGKLPLSAITKRDCQRYLDAVVSRASGPTANRHRSLLMRILNLAVEWDFLADNPAKGIRKHKENPSREVFLSVEEIKLLLMALNNSPERVSACAVKFLIATGKRLSESMCLTWDDVDLEGRIAYLREDTTKGGKAERVFLNDLAMEALKDVAKHQQGGNPHVFPGPGKTGRLLSPRRVYNKAKKEAGIAASVRLHDLRHTFASHLIGNGASIFEVQKILSHKSPAMTQRYAHLADDTLRRLSEDVGARLMPTGK